MTQDKSNIIRFILHNFSKYDCHMFFKRLVDKKNDEVKFKIIPKTNEEYISVTYGCVGFSDGYWFLSSSLDSLVRTIVDDSHKTLESLRKKIVDNDEVTDIVIGIEEDRTTEDLMKDYPDKSEKLEDDLLSYKGENDLKILKTGFPDKWKDSTKKLAYLNVHFININLYQKPVDNLKKEDFFCKLKNESPSDEEIEKSKEIIEKFNTGNGEGLTEIILKCDALLLACVFEKFLKVSIIESGINPLYCVSLTVYIWQYGLKFGEINLQTLQDKPMTSLSENIIRGGIKSIMEGRYIKSDENKKILYFVYWQY